MSDTSAEKHFEEDTLSTLVYMLDLTTEQRELLREVGAAAEPTDTPQVILDRFRDTLWERNEPQTGEFLSVPVDDEGRLQVYANVRAQPNVDGHLVPDTHIAVLLDGQPRSRDEMPAVWNALENYFMPAILASHGPDYSAVLHAAGIDNL